MHLCATIQSYKQEDLIDQHCASRRHENLPAHAASREPKHGGYVQFVTTIRMLPLQAGMGLASHPEYTKHSQFKTQNESCLDRVLLLQIINKYVYLHFIIQLFAYILYICIYIGSLQGTCILGLQIDGVRVGSASPGLLRSAV